MKKTIQTTLRTLALASLAASSLGIGNHAWAANHALIMTIDYVGVLPPPPAPGSSLPFVNKDAEMAVKIALTMGVPEGNIQVLKNSALTVSGIGNALNALKNKIADGDKVFLYYSGHGGQVSGTGSSKCSEFLVGHDKQPYTDSMLQSNLEILAQKAGQIVMLNDSCFSGGASSKSMSRDLSDVIPKYYEIDKASISSSSASYTCGDAVNKGTTRALEAVARKRTAQILYVAASSDTEYSNGNQNGSFGTIAWMSCLTGSAADRDRNGVVDGEELRSCAQSIIDSKYRGVQTVKLTGNPLLPVGFIGSSATSNASSAPVQNPRGTLESISAAASPMMRVNLTVANPRLKIARDLLDFSVTTQQNGYLHILHVSSSGKFVVLFPNKLDSNSYVNAGTHRFPRPNWGIQAQGPAGTGYFMAYLSNKSLNELDFAKALSSQETFAEGDSTAANTKELVTVATGSRFGASAVVAIQEVN